MSDAAGDGTRGPWAHEEAVLVAAVLQAGAAIREKYEGGARVYTKADNSPVTEADLAANVILTAKLRAAFPADAIVSEEEEPAADVADAPRCWIIDPLDGTASFVRHEPTFAVMVGLEVDGRPIVGAVYNPITDVLFSATAGGGARRTEGGRTAPLRFAPVAVADARIGTTPGGYETLTTATPRWAGDPAVLHLTARGFGFRPGALVNGQFDAFIGMIANGSITGGAYAWDLCATDLIIHEAGGVFTDVFGERHRYPRTHERMRGGIVGAKNAALHAHVLGLLRL